MNMLLKENDFSIKRINWEDKAKNIISILDEFSLIDLDFLNINRLSALI